MKKKTIKQTNKLLPISTGQLKTKFIMQIYQVMYIMKIKFQDAIANIQREGGGRSTKQIKLNLGTKKDTRVPKQKCCKTK